MKYKILLRATAWFEIGTMETETAQEAWIEAAKDDIPYDLTRAPVRREYRIEEDLGGQGEKCFSIEPVIEDEHKDRPDYQQEF